MALRDEDFNGSAIKVVPIRLIDIPTYQRQAVSAWAQRIADEWDHYLFTHPRLCAKADGRYDCIDGHHTVIAAELRGHTSLPCAVLVGIDHKRAAAVFSDVNTKRLRPSPYNLYIADLEAGRSWAETLREITERHGIKVSPDRGPLCLRAIAQARSIIERGWAADLDDGLYILTSAYDPGLPENETRLERKMLMGIVDLIRRSKRAEQFDRDKIIRRLERAVYTRRGVRGIHLTPKAMEADYLGALIESGHLEMPAMTTGSGNTVVYGRALAIAIYGVEQSRQLYA